MDNNSSMMALYMFHVVHGYNSFRLKKSMVKSVKYAADLSPFSGGALERECALRKQKFARHVPN